MERNFALRFSIERVRFIVEGIRAHNDDSLSTASYFQHVHTSYELHYVQAGACILDCEYQQHQLAAGNLVLIPPKAFHRFHGFSEDISKMDLAFQILFPTKEYQDANSIQFYRALQQDALVILDLRAKAYESLRTRLEQLREYAFYMADTDFVYQKKMCLFCSLLIMDLFVALTDREAQMIPVDLTSRTQSVLIDDFFNLNFDGKASREDLAKRLNVSSRHLNRTLSQYYGMGYQEKLKQVRLETAIDFLTNSDKSIAEISDLLGYSSPSNFGIFIKNETGKTPSEIRGSGIKHAK